MLTGRFGRINRRMVCRHMQISNRTMLKKLEYYFFMDKMGRVFFRFGL